MRRMLMRQLSMAFEKWQFEAAEMARSKFMMSVVCSTACCRRHGKSFSTRLLR